MTCLPAEGPALDPILRCDPVASPMNPGKAAAVHALLVAWRGTARAVAVEQWRLFHATGWFAKTHKDKALAGRIGARKLQQVRWQVVGTLESYLTNRMADFTRTVERSALAPAMRHQLHVLNRWHAWSVTPKGLPAALRDGTPITLEARATARAIMRHLRRRHRRPRFGRIGMAIDARGVQVHAARTAGHFPLWARVATLEKGLWIHLPLALHAHAAAREGERRQAVQVTPDGRGGFTVGLITDVAEPYARSRAAYRPRTPVLALDWGLRTLLATSEGDLLGRGFLDRLKKEDRALTQLARHRARSGLRVRCPKYDALVARLRGFLETEINRVVNRLIETRAPAELVVERLDFRGGAGEDRLSKRLRRIASNAGRRILAAKLADLTLRYGITVTAVNPSYSSQECGGCHYPAAENRRGEQFRCGFCGRTRHADVNAATAIAARRSRPAGWLRLPKAAVLEALVIEHLERFPGRQGPPADRRSTNRYFAPHFRAATGGTVGSSATLTPPRRARSGASGR